MPPSPTVLIAPLTAQVNVPFSGTLMAFTNPEGSTFVLKDLGKTLTCPSPVRLSAESSSDLQVTVLGNPVVGDVIDIEIRGAEGQTVHMQLRDVQGRFLTEYQLHEAQAVGHQTLFVKHQPTGLLVLRVTSGPRSVTIKQIKP